MRRRPTTRLPTFAVIVALVVTVLMPDATAQQDPQAKRDKVRQQAADVASQVNALEADQDAVEHALDALQANVSGVDAELAAAQSVADAATAVLNAAVAAQQAAEQRVAELKAIIRAMAVDSYVNAGTVGLHDDPIAGDYNTAELRDALAGFKADHDRDVLEELHVAQRDLDAKRAEAEAAFAAADAQRAELAARAADAHAARDQQASFVRGVQRRLDDKLAEARALSALDKQFSAQIDAEARALASKVSSPGATRPPPPAGNYPVPARPNASPKLATTHGITVAASIADQLGKMIDAAAADGLRFTGSGYRSYDSQVALRRQNCGTTNYDIYYRPPSECSPPTARPGNSMHEQGLAVDFAESGHALVSHDDPGWKWLSANAATFGFYNLDSEPWHWSTNGS